MISRFNLGTTFIEDAVLAASSLNFRNFRKLLQLGMVCMKWRSVRASGKLSQVSQLSQRIPILKKIDAWR